MDRFFGGTPAAVVLRLVIISVVVGIVLAALNLDALAIFDGLRNLAHKIYNMGFDAIEWALQYFLLGAVIVFPVWFVSRLVKSSRQSRNDQ